MNTAFRRRLLMLLTLGLAGLDAPAFASGERARIIIMIGEDAYRTAETLLRTNGSHERGQAVRSSTAPKSIPWFG